MKVSSFTQASEVILRHSDEFAERCVLFAGDLQDDLPAQLDTAFSRVHTQQYHHWQIVSRTLKENAYYGLIANADMVANCDTLVYFWSKNKLEIQFQLQNLLSLMPLGCDIFIIGKNQCGIRSAEKMIKSWCFLKKIDSVRRCCLYHGQLKKKPFFTVEDFWDEYLLGSLKIKTLPGVFSHDGLDTGSQMLLSTLQPHMKGKVLDIGCGVGVLAAMLASFSPKVHLTLSDVNAAAIESSKATLAANQLEGEVLVSNMYSAISDRFDMIISNPPFHNGLETSLDAAQTMIRGAVSHLKSGGELRIVANAFLPYPQMLDKVFGSHEVLLQNDRFKVYRAVKDHPPKKYLRMYRRQNTINLL